MSATKNFCRSSFIGARGFKGVYLGLIDDGKQKVTILRLPSTFMNDQVKALCKLRHDNLVSLIGYCSESQDTALVYEFIPHHETFADNLRRRAPLSWEQRLRVWIGAARGLDYLHTSTDHGVAHGDLKSSNILLTEDFKPKITDFGLVDGGQESDVHSFGILLLEMLSGKTTETSREKGVLINWAKSLIGDGDIDQIVDPRFDDRIPPKCLEEFVTIFRKCLDYDPKKRPTMVQVVALLELVLQNVCEESSARVVQAQITEAPAIAFSSNELSQCLSMADFVDSTFNFNNQYLCPLV